MDSEQMTSETIEKVARAICRAWFYCDLDTPDGREHWRREANRCRAQAKAAIQALNEPMTKENDFESVVARVEAFTARIHDNGCSLTDDEGTSLAADLQRLLDRLTPAYKDDRHPSHVTRSSDASSFDEICTLCGATDIAGAGWGKLAEPCPAVTS